MAPPQLQLHVVRVRIAKPDQAGHDPAPTGTRVWLDVPTGVIRSFTFQEFVVAASGALTPAAAGTGKLASIDRSDTYWCLWSPGQALTLPKTFDPDDFDTVTGFGRPLIAVLNNKDELILPNTRKVILREFNLSGLGDTKEMKLNRTRATAFYKDLHIELDFQAQPKPAKQPDLFIAQGSSGMALHDVKDLKTPAQAAVVELPLEQAPFRPSADVAKTVIVVWVRDFVNTGVEGKAHYPHLLLPRNAISPLVPNHTPSDMSFIFISAVGSFAKASSTAANSPEVFGHELGHVLWADAGGGREFYEGTLPGLSFSAAELTTYQNRINALFLDRLGLGVPANTIGSLLEGRDHHHLAKNLMFAFPANSGTASTGLTFLQVGLFRLAPELRWPNEP